jgi:hypothetical protein
MIHSAASARIIRRKHEQLLSNIRKGIQKTRKFTTPERPYLLKPKTHFQNVQKE